MTKLRIGLRSLLALPVAVGLLLWIPRSCTTAIGDGAPVNVPLNFVVVDETTGQPIEGASVTFPDCNGSGITLAATTSPDGRARILLDTVFSEGYNTILMHRVYRHISYRQDVEVSATGYRPSKIRLEDLTDDPRFHYDPVPPPILVRLKRESIDP
jgi:hypothetical protein